jgi:hypothetical protein
LHKIAAVRKESRDVLETMVVEELVASGIEGS